VRHKTGDIWHLRVRNIPAGQLYGYPIDRPYQPEPGHRCNPPKLLMDPFGRAIASPKAWDFSPARGYDSSSNLTDLCIWTVDNADTTPQCIFIHDDFDWKMDLPLGIPPPIWSSTRHSFAVSRLIRVRGWHLDSVRECSRHG
jgi:glycogen operon protein